MDTECWMSVIAITSEALNLSKAILSQTSADSVPYPLLQQRGINRYPNSYNLSPAQPIKVFVSFSIIAHLSMPSSLYCACIISITLNES